MHDRTVGRAAGIAAESDPHVAVGRLVRARIKARIAQIGLDPDHYAGHSLRSGAVTTLLAEGGGEVAVLGLRRLAGTGRRGAGHASRRSPARFPGCDR